MGRSSRRRKRRKPRFGLKISLIHVIVFIAMVIVFTFTYLLVSDNYGIASRLYDYLNRDLKEIVETDGVRMIDGDFTIDAPGERLENVHVYGNLYLAKNIGNGSVDLVNVTVDGLVLVQGGGMNTIYIVDSALHCVRVNRPEGRVRLVASGDSIVNSITLETGARILENLVQGAEGFLEVEVNTDEKVELVGTFDSLKVSLKDANIGLESDFINEIIISGSASGTVIKYPDGLHISNLYLESNAYLLGRSEVERAYFAAGGINELSGNYNQVSITAEAGRFELVEESTFAEIVVESEAFNNRLNLHKNVTVAFLELNEAVDVTGIGEIGKVIINAAGSTLEQIPQDIEFTVNTSVMIAGYEITSSAMLYSLQELGDPYYYADPGSSVAADTQVLASGQDNKGEEAAQAEPEPYPEPEIDPGTETETQSNPEPGPDSELDHENSGSQDENNNTEIDSDNLNDLIQYFQVERGISPGKKLVIVVLSVADQKNYKIMVGGTELEYRDAIMGFRGEVPETDAVREKVVVSR